MNDYRTETAQRLLAEGGIISVQSLNEFVSVVRRELGLRWEEVREALAAIEKLCPSPRSITAETHNTALRLAERFSYHIFDSLILASALESRSKTLYSEDMHDGQRIQGLTIKNPFSA